MNDEYPLIPSRLCRRLHGLTLNEALKIGAVDDVGDAVGNFFKEYEVDGQRLHYAVIQGFLVECCQELVNNKENLNKIIGSLLFFRHYKNGNEYTMIGMPKAKAARMYKDEYKILQFVDVLFDEEFVVLHDRLGDIVEPYIGIEDEYNLSNSTIRPLTGIGRRIDQLTKLQSQDIRVVGRLEETTDPHNHFITGYIHNLAHSWLLKNEEEKRNPGRDDEYEYEEEWGQGQPTERLMMNDGWDLEKHIRDILSFGFK